MTEKAPPAGSVEALRIRTDQHIAELRKGPSRDQEIANTLTFLIARVEEAEAIIEDVRKRVTGEG